MIIRESSPLNLESSFEDLDSELTRTDQFYVRCHFPIPPSSAATYRLTLEGSVERSTTWSLAQLKQMPAVRTRFTMECAGNGRIFLDPQVHGAQWALGAVGTAEWTGVLLSSLLTEAGIDSAAIEVVLEGADAGKAKEPPAPPGEMHYARSLPIAKAMDDVLLAYEMNGKPLTAEHGGPLRAVVPGWFGMAWVKWLHRIIASDRPFHGYFQTIDYAFWKQQDGLLVRSPLTRMQLKSQIARPMPHEIIPRSSRYRIFGAAWSGESPVAKVEISTDGGRQFSPANLLAAPAPNVWQLWEHHWLTPASSGPVTLLSRATDSAGDTQPDHRDNNWGTYVICHTLPIEVLVQ